MKYSKGYTTHYTMLMKTVSACSGNVLEYGSGIYSTPLLHWLCKDLGKKLVTLESNQEFFKIAYQFRSRLHSIKFVEDWDSIPIREHWGVVLIDHDEPYQRRGKDALRYKSHADYIVLHDTETEKIYGYDDIWHNFKYRYDWKACRPWTSVISNFKNLSWLGEVNS